MHHTRGQRMASNKFPRVWVLQGQGSPDTTSPRTVQLALRDSENPVAHALLIACHDAFIKDFESLSADERPDANLPHEMFSEPRSLLTSCRKHPTNAIIANTSLFLFQILRYIAHTIPTNILSRDASIEDLGVIGLSSGLYAASVIASAHSVPSLISYAVFCLKKKIWLGLRIQQFTTREAPNDLASRWCLVVLGSTLPDIKRAISFFMAAVRPHDIPVRPLLTSVTNLPRTRDRIYT